MSFEFHDILCLIAVAQLALFSFFLVTQKRGNRLSNRLLALFLFSKCLSIINHLFVRLELRNPDLFFILVPVAFLWGPSLYLYIKSRVHEKFRLSGRDALHLIPFVLVWTYFTFIYHLRSSSSKSQIITGVMSEITTPQIMIVGTLHLLILLYMIGAVRILLKYKIELNSVSEHLEKKNLSWLRFVLFGFILIWSIDAGEFFLAIFAEPELFLSSVALVLLFVFANVVVYQGLRMPEVFQGNGDKKKYQNSPMTEEEKKEYLERLYGYMEHERPYLNPSLTLDKLARRLAIPSRYLSQIINESLGVNFFDFVNGYRIEEAKKLFLDTSNGQRSILDLLFDAGFNTKSVFNRAFKKYTGMTPSEFKRYHQSSQRPTS